MSPVILLLSHSTMAADAALSDAPDAVARNLAHIAADVADVLRVTDATMQIALCITQRIANDRSLVPGSRAQFGPRSLVVVRGCGRCCGG